MGKRKLRRRIEDLEDTIRLMRDLDRHAPPPPTVPLETVLPSVVDGGWRPATSITVSDSNIRCTCADKHRNLTFPYCWLHDVSVTYTTAATA